MDRIAPEIRSRVMAQIGGKHTAPEMAVREILSRMGIRYRLHAKDLPGKPDIVNRKRGFAIFVHGCFWHGHSCRRGAKPTSNTTFWNQKLSRNKERDAAAVTALKRGDWRVLTVWECEIKDRARTERRISTWLRKFTDLP